MLLSSNHDLICTFQRIIQYINRIQDIIYKKVTGPGISLDLDDDLFIVSKEE